MYGQSGCYRSHRGETVGMKSRVHPTYKTKYRVKNWASYERALVRRGDITVWLSPDAISNWAPASVGKRGGQWKYSDLAIETALTLRLIFNLPLRQTEGFLNSLFGMMGIDLSAPDHTPLSRRGQHLDVKLHRVPTGKATHLAHRGRESPDRPPGAAPRGRIMELMRPRPS